MADSTTNIAQVDSSQAQKEVTVNGLFDASSPAMFGGRRAEACAGLVWGYYGGRWGGSAVANGTVTLLPSTTNYIVADRLTGAIMLMDGSPDLWADTLNYARLYAITTGTAAVTSYADHRVGPDGLFVVTPPDQVSPIGRHAVPVAAGSMRPSATGGCAALSGIASASNQPDIVTLNFDPTTQEYAQFSVAMPSSWDRGTLTFRAHWSHPTTTTDFGVAWDLQAVAVGNDDPIAVAFGTAQVVVDTGGTTNDLYSTPESSAITVAGTPQAEDVVFFRLSRATGNGADNMAVDARLHGITLYMTTDAAVDE